MLRTYLVAVVLFEVKEVKDIGVPGLEVDGDGSLALSTALIDVACGVVEDTQHRDDAIRRAVCTTDVRARRTDVMNCQANTTCCRHNTN